MAQDSPQKDFKGSTVGCSCHHLVTMAAAFGVTKTVGDVMQQQKPAGVAQAAWLPEAALGGDSAKPRIPHCRSAILELSPRSAVPPADAPGNRTLLKSRTAMLHSPKAIRSRTAMLVVEPEPMPTNSWPAELSLSEIGTLFSRRFKSIF
uniref:Uncharacterized protein n=1 Tax=Alexandrium monilatum TaxID=311494 RepID=A0A7S4Q2Z2_9DINO